MGWKISLKAWSPTSREPANATKGSASHSPIMGICPARKIGSAYASMASTFFFINAGSSLVPERYGPAIKISIGSTKLADMGSFLTEAQRQYNAHGSECYRE